MAGRLFGRYTGGNMNYLLCVFTLIVFALSVQYILTKIEDIRYPAPGKMVDIGGYSLHLYDTGSGPGPTIVLDMGLGGNMLYWSLVQPEIAKFARVVSYDRAGIGWSDKSPLPRTNENIAEELHILLHAANIPGPYILVGHSYAGIIARVYTNKYNKEVAGVILVDASNENQGPILPKPTDFLSKLLYSPKFHPWFKLSARIGLHRIFHLYNGHSDKFDKKISRMMTAKNSSNKFIDALLAEWKEFDTNLIDVQNKKYFLDDITLIVITANMAISKKSCALHGHDFPDPCVKAHKIWHELQHDLVTKSTNAKQIMAHNSAHVIQKYEPEIIVEAVREMISLSDR
jgi:pimeloyl-ACP methyl ester carboxylesterase